MPNYKSIHRAFHALSDPTRLAVVEHLCRSPASVSELRAPHDMALPSFLQHLQVLEECGLIRSRKIGRVRMCEVVPNRLADTEAWISRQRDVWEGRTDRLAGYVESLTNKEKP